MKRVKATIIGLICLTPIMGWATPMVYNSCRGELNHPANATSHFYSEDCQTVYVAPPTFGKISYYNIEWSDDIDQQCAIGAELSEQLLANSKKSLQLTTQLAELVEKMEESGPEKFDAVLKLFEEHNAARQQLHEESMEIRKQQGEWANHVGLVADFMFTKDWDGHIAEYRAANPGVQFKRLPLLQSVLSVLERDVADNSIEMRTVLEIKMNEPAFLGEDGRRHFLAEKLYDSSMKGQLALSVVGACGLVNKNQPLEEALSYTVLGNLSIAYLLEDEGGMKEFYSSSTFK